MSKTLSVFEQLNKDLDRALEEMRRPAADADEPGPTEAKIPVQPADDAAVDGAPEDHEAPAETSEVEPADEADVEAVADAQQPTGDADADGASEDHEAPAEAEISDPEPEPADEAGEPGAELEVSDPEPELEPVAEADNEAPDAEPEVSRSGHTQAGNGYVKPSHNGKASHDRSWYQVVYCGARNPMLGRHFTLPDSGPPCKLHQVR